MAWQDGIRRLLLAVHAVDNLTEFVGMFGVKLNHTLCKLCLILLVEHIATAHAASHYVPKHVLSAYGLIVSLAHELAQYLHLLGWKSVFGAQSVHSHLRNTLQHLVAIASDVQLNAMLEVRVVVLEALLGSIAHGVEHKLHGCAEVFLVALKARAVNPMEADVGTVGSGPLGRVATFLAHTVEYGCLKLLRYLLLTRAQQYESDAERLRFGYLVVPPVAAVGVDVLPMLQSFYYVFVEGVLAIVLVLAVGVGSSPLLQTVQVLERGPVGKVVA